MGVFNFLRGPDINQGVKEYGETGGALLLDVRTPQEYRAGRLSVRQAADLAGMKPSTFYKKIGILFPQWKKEHLERQI